MLSTAVDSSRCHETDVLMLLQLGETLVSLACELNATPDMVGEWLRGGAPLPGAADPDSQPDEQQRLQCELEWLRIECRMLREAEAEMRRKVNQRVAAVWNPPAR